MILKHNKNICDITKSEVYDDNVVKNIFKNLTPYTIYAENKEFIDSFATTLVNYSPISLNIVDYWNKDIIDNSVFVPKNDTKIEMGIIHPFEFAESDPPVDADYGLGFSSEYGLGGALTSTSDSFDNISKTTCPNEAKDRFFINSMIGLQDKLAYVNMYNYYSVLNNTAKDTVISNRLYKILDRLGLSTDGLFDNTNTLFKEERYLANRHLNEKKGTIPAIRYVGQSAMDSNIQGKDLLTTDYYMDIVEDSPFNYSVESNLLDVVFERFVKPLSHPIGFMYNYRTVCRSELADENEYPLIRFDYSNTYVYVACLCFSTGQEDVPLPQQPEDINCVFGTYPDKRFFATPDGTGLWEGISQDEGTGNIPYDYEEGVSGELEYKNQSYKKWTFENKNYLIAYTNDTNTSETSERVTVNYYRYDSFNDTYDLAAQFINQRHCNIGILEEPKKISWIKESFGGNCNDIEYGMFQFLADGEVTLPNNPAPSGMYEGFMGSITGGVLDRWTDLYFGHFQFLGREESQDYQVGEWPVTGLTEGFNESILINQYATIPEYPNNTE